MTINEKILQLKKNIKEIDKISDKIGNNQSYKKKIEELNNEILTLKRGIRESIEELEEFLGVDNAKN